MRLLKFGGIVFLDKFWSWSGCALRCLHIAGTNIFAVSARVEVRARLLFALTLINYLLAARKVLLDMRKLFFHCDQMRSTLQLLH